MFSSGTAATQLMKHLIFWGCNRSHKDWSIS